MSLIGKGALWVMQAPRSNGLALHSYNTIHWMHYGQFIHSRTRDITLIYFTYQNLVPTLPSMQLCIRACFTYTAGLPETCELTLMWRISGVTSPPLCVAESCSDAE